jgi:hypothetical protein
VPVAVTHCDIYSRSFFALKDSLSFAFYPAHLAVQFRRSGMICKFYVPGLAFMAVAVLATQSAFAETPGEILAAMQKEAAGTPGFQGFSSPRGESFFKTKHGNDWSCTSCHTDNPAVPGKHDRTGKTIKPLAPSANAERFTSQKKVDKWFKRNCKDVLGRVCTVQEKGDVLAYLLAVKN